MCSAAKATLGLTLCSDHRVVCSPRRLPTPSLFVSRQLIYHPAGHLLGSVCGECDESCGTHARVFARLPMYESISGIFCFAGYPSSCLPALRMECFLVAVVLLLVLLVLLTCDCKVSVAAHTGVDAFPSAAAAGG